MMGPDSKDSSQQVASTHGISFSTIQKTSQVDSSLLCWEIAQSVWSWNLGCLKAEIHYMIFPHFAVWKSLF